MFAPLCGVGERDDLVGQVDLDAVLGALRACECLAERAPARRSSPGSNSTGSAQPSTHLSQRPMWVGIDWKIGPAVRARGHEVPEVDVGVADAGGVVEVGQAEVVAVLVGEHADARVLGLHDVVRELEVGAGDRPRRRRRRRSAPRWRTVPSAPPPPDLSSPACTSTTWSMTPSGSRKLPSPSTVALVLDVVVGPREVGLRVGERLRPRRSAAGRRRAGCRGGPACPGPRRPRRRPRRSGGRRSRRTRPRSAAPRPTGSPCRCTV